MRASNGDSFFKQLLPYLSVVAVTAVFAVAGVVRFTNPDRRLLGLELVKAFVQVATVLVLGQVLAIIAKDREHDREANDRAIAASAQEREAIVALHKDVLGKLTSAFVRVKGSRRLLRAEALTVPWSTPLTAETEVRRRPYGEQLRLVNQAELDLEALWHQLDVTNPTAERETLVANVRDMKDYLREILYNFEHVMPQFTADDAVLPIGAFHDESKYGTLIDFLSDGNVSKFRERFVLPFRAASKAIRRAVLTGTDV